MVDLSNLDVEVGGVNITKLACQAVVIFIEKMVYEKLKATAALTSAVIYSGVAYIYEFLMNSWFGWFPDWLKSTLSYTTDELAIGVLFALTEYILTSGWNLRRIAFGNFVWYSVIYALCGLVGAAFIYKPLLNPLYVKPPRVQVTNNGGVSVGVNTPVSDIAAAIAIEDNPPSISAEQL